MMQILRSLAIFLSLALAASNAFANSGLLGLRRSVFRIQVVSQDTNFLAPWKVQPAGTSSGSGFYIGNNRILTNAHVVANSTYITIQRDGDPEPVPAFVVYIAHDADLAVISTKDQSFFKDVEALDFGSLPHLRSPVSTLGYPAGGDQISITDGVVSRVSYRRYVHSGYKEHLLVQVDSAINPGNSGGPVLQGRLVVGVAFQTFTAAENTGYIIPTPVIKRFLRDIEDGRYDGHPDDGISFARWTVSNPATAEFHGLTELGIKNGVKVTAVSDWAPTADFIKAGDILTTIEGLEIGVDGRIVFEGERVDFPAIFDLRLIGDEVNFGVVRDRKFLEVRVKVTPSRSHYVSGDVYAKHPKFMLLGGLVFTALSRSYLKTWGTQWYKRAPTLLRYFDMANDFVPELKGVEDVIVLASRLPHPVNTYVNDQVQGVLLKVNGERVLSIADLSTKIRNASGEFLVFEFFGDNDLVVIKRDEAMLAATRIREQYKVSPEVWFDGPGVDGAIFGTMVMP